MMLVGHFFPTGGGFVWCCANLHSGTDRSQQWLRASRAWWWEEEMSKMPVLVLGFCLQVFANQAGHSSLLKEG